MGRVLSHERLFGRRARVTGVQGLVIPMYPGGPTGREPLGAARCSVSPLVSALLSSRYGPNRLPRSRCEVLALAGPGTSEGGLAWNGRCRRRETRCIRAGPDPTPPVSSQRGRCGQRRAHRDPDGEKGRRTRRRRPPATGRGPEQTLPHSLRRSRLCPHPELGLLACGVLRSGSVGGLTFSVDNAPSGLACSPNLN